MGGASTGQGTSEEQGGGTIAFALDRPDHDLIDFPQGARIDLGAGQLALPGLEGGPGCGEALRGTLCDFARGTSGGAPLLLDIEGSAEAEGGLPRYGFFRAAGNRYTLTLHRTGDGLLVEIFGPGGMASASRLGVREADPVPVVAPADPQDPNVPAANLPDFGGAWDIAFTIRRADGTRGASNRFLDRWIVDRSGAVRRDRTSALYDHSDPGSVSGRIEDGALVLSWTGGAGSTWSSIPAGSARIAYPAAPTGRLEGAASFADGWLQGQAPQIVLVNFEGHMVGGAKPGQGE